MAQAGGYGEESLALGGFTTLSNNFRVRTFGQVSEPKNKTNWFNGALLSMSTVLWENDGWKGVLNFKPPGLMDDMFKDFIWFHLQKTPWTILMHYKEEKIAKILLFSFQKASDFHDTTQSDGKTFLMS